MSTLIESFLSTTEEKQRLNDWMFETIKPFIKGRIFEIHSGEGEFSSRLINHGFTIQLNAISDSNRKYLRDKFKESTMVRGVHKIDFFREDLEEEYSHFENQFPTVIVRDDIEENVINTIHTIKKAKRLLSHGGRFIVIGQCPTVLFPGTFPDIKLLKQHNRDWISKLMINCNLIKTWYFIFGSPNFISVAEKV